jgi:hypothetical protein
MCGLTKLSAIGASVTHQPVLQKRKSVVPSPLKPAVPQTVEEIMFGTASEAIRH